MPLISPQDNLDFLMNAVPGRRERIQEEERQQATDMQDPLDILAGLRERITPITQSLYPGNPLSTEESTRLGDLSRRQRRLAPSEPLQYGQVGSARNPGNPYSIDTRGAAQGIGNLAVALINRQKEKRRGTFEDELVDLSGRQESEQQRAAATQRMIEELAPDLVSQEYQSTRDAAQATRESELVDKRAENEQALEQLRQEGRVELQTMRSDLESGNASPSLISGFSNTARQAGMLYADKAEQLREIKNGDFFNDENYDGDIDDDIKANEDKAARAFRIAGRTYSQSGSVDNALMDELEGVLGLEQPEAEQSTDATPDTTDESEIDLGPIFPQ